jgi:hypothetical protein
MKIRPATRRTGIGINILGIPVIKLMGNRNQLRR